jgi:hypothetical protein
MPAMRNQSVIGICVFVLGLSLAWELGGKLADGDMQSITFIVLGFIGCAVIVTTLRNWRTGFYLFFVWMMFEDLVRKYMGNNLGLFFGKDIVLAFVYASLYIEIRRGRENTFRPPFLFALSLFFWLGALQIFNPNSPHILYSLLGFKVFFYYVPLIFVGYALIRTDGDLLKLLTTNAVLAGLIAILGIFQAILGNTFLNPAKLDPDLEGLGNLYKSSPLSGHIFSLPDSVFVSSGRYAEYLIWTFILVMGTAAYLLLHPAGRRKLVFAVVGVLGVATLLSGSRSAVVGVSASSLALSAAFLWGAPWRWGQAHRLVRAIRRSFVVAALSLAALLLFFPEDAGSRIAFYTETLNPSSSAYQGVNRSWDYPVDNFLSAFKQPNWILGNGIGTASLGGQYVAKVTGTRPLNISVEEGYGQLIIEMGILAPVLWILWTAALLYYAWKVARRLQNTRLFPIAIAIVWYIFVLLYPFTYAGLAPYENYISNAYLWLLTGVLFRLPSVLDGLPELAVVPSRRRRRDGLRS